MKAVGGICCLSMVLFVGSCAGDGFDKETFSGGVTNTQLSSPKIDENSFSTLTNSDGSENVKVTWSVVMGAGGYLFNVNIVDDPSNPIVVVKDSVIDGSSAVFTKLEDTKYEVSVKALGNEKLHNTDAPSATEFAYSTLISAVTIPAGQDIAEFVKANLQPSDKEQGFELEAGKAYTLNDLVDFGINQITFRGDKAHRPTVVVGATGGIVTEGGLKVKFINFDCSAMSAANSQVGLVTLGNAVTSGAPATEKGGAYLISNPIIFQECNFKGVNNSIIYAGKDNGPWAVQDLRLTNCIAELNNGASSKPIINFEDNGGRAIKSLTISKNTFYNLQTNSKAYFIRLNNASNARPDKTWNDTSGSVTITNNTFFQTMSNKDFANNMASVNTVTTTIKNNIFYNTYRVQKIVGNTTKAIGDNYLFSSGATNVGALDNTDKTYGTEEDPAFIGPVDQDPDQVNFVPASSTKAYSNKAGDPRWYK